MRPDLSCSTERGHVSDASGARMTAHRLDSRQSEQLQNTRVFRHARPWLTEPVAIAVAYQAAPAGNDCDVLLALSCVGNDAAVVPDAIVMGPQFLTRRRIPGAQNSGRVGDEQQVSAGGEQTGMRRNVHRLRPGHLSGDRIAGIDMSVHARLTFGRARFEVSADVELRHRLENRCRFDDLQVYAPFVSDLIEQPGPRIVRAGIPADSAHDRGAQVLVLSFGQIASPDQSSVVLNGLYEVDVLDQRPDFLRLRVTVVDVDEAILAGMHDVFLAAP